MNIISRRKSPDNLRKPTDTGRFVPDAYGKRHYPDRLVLVVTKGQKNALSNSGIGCLNACYATT